MGVYDSIMFNCPDCGEVIEAQSKSGPCECVSYNYKKVPLEVAYNANRHAPFECSCGSYWTFKHKFIYNISDDGDGDGTVELVILKDKGGNNE